RGPNGGRGKCRSRREAVDTTFFKPTDQVATCASAHRRRAGNNPGFSAGAMGPSQFRGDLANDGRLGFLCVNNVVDELKWIGVCCGSLHRDNTDSLVSNNNLVAFFDIEKLNSP